MNVPRRALFAVLLMLPALAPVAVRAQNIYMKDGQIIQAKGLRRSDTTTVLASIQTAAGQQGEVGYPVANIDHIDFPEPAQLKLAGDLLSNGKTDDALRQLGPIVAYYSPFRDIKGNFWTPLVLLQLDAFTKLGRTRDADALISEISRAGITLSPETLRAVKIQQAAGSEKAGDHRKALDTLDPIVKDTTLPPDALSEAWLTVGQAQLAMRNYKDAVLAFLHIPVYTPDKAALMPPALLGSAIAYVGLDDGQRAQNVLKELIAAYPNAPEATEAKERLARLKLPAAKPAGS